MRRERIGLLDQYTGENLGDAAILEAALHAVRTRRPDADVVLITLYPAGAEARHGIPSYPMTGLQVRWYSSSPDEYARRTGLAAPKPASTALSPPRVAAARALGLKARLKRSPWLFGAARAVHGMVVEPMLRRSGHVAASLRNWRNEARHFVRSWRMLREFDVLIVSGGGQIDDDFGGPWGHPYSLMKWAFLSRLTGTRFAVLSVGVCSLNHHRSEDFFGKALRRAEYRSYRDERSRELIANRFSFTRNDPVVPDLAFSHPRRAQRRAATCGTRLRIGISPIVYLSPRWPKRDADAFERYATELTSVVVRLVQAGHEVSMFQSDDNDTSVVNEIGDRALARLDSSLHGALHRIHIGGLDALFVELESLDCLIASRLHGVLLAHLVERPVVAISYDPKVTSHMEYMAQAEFCLEFVDFTADSALNTLDGLLRDIDGPLDRIRERSAAFRAQLESQYDHVLGRPMIETAREPELRARATPPLSSV